MTIGFHVIISMETMGIYRSALFKTGLPVERERLYNHDAKIIPARREIDPVSIEEQGRFDTNSVSQLSILSKKPVKYDSTAAIGSVTAPGAVITMDAVPSVTIRNAKGIPGKLAGMP